MTVRFGAISVVGAGAFVALGLLAAPVRAAADPQTVYIECMGDKVVELCAASASTTRAAGEAKPPTFDAVVAACAAERGAFVDLVTTRNLAAGRSADYAARRVTRHTRRLEGLAHRLYDECMETTP